MKYILILYAIIISVTIVLTIKTIVEINQSKIYWKGEHRDDCWEEGTSPPIIIENPSDTFTIDSKAGNVRFRIGGGIYDPPPNKLVVNNPKEIQ